MKMDAIIKPAPQKGLELVRKDVPVLSDGDALVKIHKTAICGTDVHIYNWDESAIWSAPKGTSYAAPAATAAPDADIFVPTQWA